MLCYNEYSVFIDFWGRSLLCLQTHLPLCCNPNKQSYKHKPVTKEMSSGLTYTCKPRFNVYICYSHVFTYYCPLNEVTNGIKSVDD